MRRIIEVVCKPSTRLNAPEYLTSNVIGPRQDGSKTMVTRNPYQSPLDNLFQKPEIKRGQVKKVASDLPVHVPSNSTVCSMLKVFADQLLEGNYNCKSFHFTLNRPCLRRQ